MRNDFERFITSVFTVYYPSSYNSFILPLIKRNILASKQLHA